MGRLNKVIDDVHFSAFTSKVGSQADNLYRFASAVVMDRRAAFDVVQGVIEFAGKQLDAVGMRSASDVKNLIYKECWQLAKSKASGVELAESLAKLVNLDAEQRAVLILSDFIGFRTEEVSDILGCDDEHTVRALIVARKAMVG